jgi:hypothetical protein
LGSNRSGYRGCRSYLGAINWILSNTFKKGMSTQKLNEIHERIKAYDVKVIDCDRRFIQLEERKTDNHSIENIRTDLALIKGTLQAALSGSNIDALIQSKSPISLNDLGRELAERMDLETRISNNWGKIYEFLDNNLQSKNAYDIQQFCIETASVFPERFFSDEDVEFLKNFAYKEGRPLVYYGGMIGIMIRDSYFKSKGIDVSEVDKCNPAKN